MCGNIASEAVVAQLKGVSCQYKTKKECHQMTTETKSDYEIVVEILKTKSLSREKLFDLRGLIERQISQIDEAEKVKIYGVRNGDIRTYYRTPEEAKEAVVAEVAKVDASDMEYFDVMVEPLFIAEADLEEYVGKWEML